MQAPDLQGQAALGRAGGHHRRQVDAGADRRAAGAAAAARRAAAGPRTLLGLCFQQASAAVWRPAAVAAAGPSAPATALAASVPWAIKLVSVTLSVSALLGLPGRLHGVMPALPGLSMDPCTHAVSSLTDSG